METEQRRWSLTAGGHAGGLQQSVFQGMPLLEQGLVSTFNTIVIQILSSKVLSPLYEYETEEAFCPKTMVKKQEKKIYSDKKIKNRPKGP